MSISGCFHTVNSAVLKLENTVGFDRVFDDRSIFKSVVRSRSPISSHFLPRRRISCSWADKVCGVGQLNVILISLLTRVRLAVTSWIVVPAPDLAVWIWYVPATTLPVKSRNWTTAVATPSAESGSIEGCAHAQARGQSGRAYVEDFLAGLVQLVGLCPQPPCSNSRHFRLCPHSALLV